MAPVALRPPQSRRARIQLQAKKKKVDPDRAAKRAEAARKREEAMKRAEEIRQQRAAAAAPEAPPTPDRPTAAESAPKPSPVPAPAPARKKTARRPAAAPAPQPAPKATPEPSPRAAAAHAKTTRIEQRVEGQEDYSTLKVTQLRAMLTSRGLPTSGKKAVLIERLAGSAPASTPNQELAAEAAEAAEAAPRDASATALGRMTVKQLKELLRQRGLPTTGKKADLIARCGLPAADGNPASGPSPTEFCTGDYVHARWEDDEWYSAVVKQVHDDGTVTIAWDQDSAQHRRPVADVKLQPNRVAFSRLRVGQKYPGTIQRIIEIGAFVDIGTDRLGLVRTTRLAEGYVSNVHDTVSVGQEVDVWVYRIPASGKLGLSMTRYPPSDVKDPLSAFQGASPSDWFQGTIRFSSPEGFYVDVEAPDGDILCQGFLPKNLCTTPDVGAKVKVRVLRTVENSGTLHLSMRKPPR